MINTMIRRFVAGTVAGFALLASLSILTITNASGAYADSAVDGQITQSEVIARAWDWVNRRPYIKYDSSGRTSYPDAAGKQYRPDCSGAVSMAWHVGTSYNTSTLPSAPKVRLIAADPSSSTDLRTGDLLNVVNGPNGEHHAVLFDQWEADHVHFSVFSFGGGSDGSTPPQHETGRTFSGSVGGHPGSIYSAYRYDNVLPDTLVSDSEQLQFADMNNDRVADLISMRSNGDVVAYWNVGGIFNGTNKLVASGFKEPARTRFADMNSDGVADL
ncbi:Repeat domain-containing protein, partial [Streptosporangium subroseum]